jgi:hypothetical protein
MYKVFLKTKSFRHQLINTFLAEELELPVQAL